MPHTGFVPLRVLSSYSMLEGAIDPKALAALARDRGFPAIAVADRNGLYCAPAFASACKDKGVQPIIGTLLAVARDDRDGAGVRAGSAPAIDWLPLYAQDETGWLNLCHLVSQAHLGRPAEFDPHVRLDDLAGHTEGLIALTGAGEGALTRLAAAGQSRDVERLADRLEALFPGRLYNELTRRRDPVEDAAGQFRGRNT